MYVTLRNASQGMRAILSIVRGRSLVTPHLRVPFVSADREEGDGMAPPVK